MAHVIGSSARPDWTLAVVIGAGGMGMAAARRLSQRHRVLIADIDQARIEQAAETLRQEGGDAVGIQCDITDAAAVEALCARVDQLGGFKVLAHIAGLSPSMADFQTIMRVNLVGAVTVAEGLRPRATPGTAAVLISSLAGHVSSPPASVQEALRTPLSPNLLQSVVQAIGEDQATPQFAYAASKHALMAYCRRAAPAWGERGGRIVSLSPGLIATPQGAREFEHSRSKRDLYARTPLQREGTMLEIADVIEFLTSDRASFISGTDLLVDGGLFAALSKD